MKIHPLKKLALAASYISSLPYLPKPQSEDELVGLAKYLPIVGIFIGAILALVLALCLWLHFNSLATALVILVAWICITGSIHLDGWMDAADGIFSHRSKERMLEIMRDSRVGNFGAIAGILLILTKYVSLLSLHSFWIWTALLAIPAWARWLEVFVIAVYPYARAEGMGKIWHATTSISDILLAAIAPLLFTLLISFVFKAPAVFLVIPLTVLPGIAMSYYIYRILDGQTGDTYGASVEFAEVCGLLFLSQTIH